MDAITGIKTYIQKTPYTCGPACLKIVSQYYNRIYSESKISNIASCDPIFGTTHANMVRAARKLGFTVRHQTFTSIKEIEHAIQQNIPVIVDYLQYEDGHYSVITGYDNKKLKIIDPGCQIQRSRKIERKEFLKWWNYGIEFDSGFTDPREDSLKWAMIMIPRPQRYKLGTLFM